MYTEIVGTTAVRKSSKVRNIMDEFMSRIDNLKDPVDFVNYTYFMIRLMQLEIG